MNILKVKDGDGNWVTIPALKGAPTDAQVQDAVDDYLDTQSATSGFFTNAAKHALLNLLRKAAYKDNDAATYFSALEVELFNIPVSTVSATFTQGQNTVYNTDDLDILKRWLSVTVTYIDGTSEQTTGYTLTGTLTAGTSIITVNYGGKTDTISVTVTDGFLYNPSKGILSNQSYITKTDKAAGGVSEAVANGELIITVPLASSVYPGSEFAFSPSTFSSYARLKAEFKISTEVWITSGNTTSYGVVQFCIGDGENRSMYGFVRESSRTGDFKSRYNIGSGISWGASITPNEWHTIQIEIANGKQTVWVDDVKQIDSQNLASSSVTSRLVFASMTQSETYCYIRSLEYSAE